MFFKEWRFGEEGGNLLDGKQWAYQPVFFPTPGQMHVCLEKYDESEIIALQEIRPNGLKWKLTFIDYLRLFYVFLKAACLSQAKQNED